MPKKPTPKKPEPAPNEVPPTAKPKSKAKGMVDPEILAIRAKAREEIKQLQDRRNSGRRLEVIWRMIPRLNPDDVNRLRDYLNRKDQPIPVIPGEAEAVEGPTMTEPAAPAEEKDPWLV